MSFARTVIKMSHMPVEMQENAIQVAQEAIRDNNTEEVSWTCAQADHPGTNAVRKRIQFVLSNRSSI
jgi:tRNA1(Val) A37 N6-methylase TrmN6